MFSAETPSVRFVRLLNDTVSGPDLIREGESGAIVAILGSDQGFILEFAGNRLISLSSERVTVLSDIAVEHSVPLRKVG